MLLQKYSLFIVSILNTLCGHKGKIYCGNASESFSLHTALWVKIMVGRTKNSENATNITAKIYYFHFFVRAPERLKSNPPPTPHYSISEFNPQASTQQNISYKKACNLL
jgi:hypothetical protein